MDVAPWVQHAEVFIAGDDESRLGGEHASEHGIIIGITTNLERQSSRGNELCKAAVLRDSLFGCLAGARNVLCVLLAMQHHIDLGDQLGAGETIDLIAPAQALELTPERLLNAVISDLGMDLSTEIDPQLSASGKKGVATR